MNRIITRSLFAACAILFAVSCTKENNEPIAPNKGQEPVTSDLVFTAAHEDVNITKTTLNSNLTPEWTIGDAIGLTSATDTNVECELLSAEEGTFNGSAVLGEAPFHAVYPYSLNNTFSGSVLTAEVPQVQTVAEGQNVAPGALVAACVSESTELAFRNCVSLMQLDLPVDNIKSVVIESTGENEYLAGNSPWIFLRRL